MDFVLDSCFKNCHNKYFHKFKYECIYDIKFKNIANNGVINFAVNGKNMDLYDLNNKLKVAREKCFIFILTKQTHEKNLFTSTIYKYKSLFKISNSYVP